MAAELALSGYPFHVWALPYAGASLFSSASRRQDLAHLLNCADQIPLITDFYTKAAVEADGAELEAIRACCTKNSIRAVVGFSERDGGSLYMSQWIVGPAGDVVVRRKFRPTSLERIVFGDGDVRSAFLPTLLATFRTILLTQYPNLQGSDVKVHKTELGNLGVLQCWVRWTHLRTIMPPAYSAPLAGTRPVPPQVCHVVAA